MNQDFEDKNGDLFPNSPALPGTKQPAKTGNEAKTSERLSDNEDMQEEYTQNDTIDLPSPPSLSKYSKGRIETMRVGVIGLTIANSLRSSYVDGGDYKADLSHWIGCLQAMNLDAPTVTKLKKFRSQLDETHSLDVHKKIICEDARGVLLDLRVKK
ncbi:MAG: hypothetical protein ACLQGU_17760 [bacterium]